MTTMKAHTAGPWEVTKGLYGRQDENTIWGPKDKHGCHAKVCTVDGVFNSDADAALIASAPTLLAERDRLKEINAGLLAALSPLADIGIASAPDYLVRIDRASIERARAAISRATVTP